MNYYCHNCDCELTSEDLTVYHGCVYCPDCYFEILSRLDRFARQKVTRHFK